MIDKGTQEEIQKKILAMTQSGLGSSILSISFELI